MIRFAIVAAAVIGLTLAPFKACCWTTPADITNWPDYECGPRTGRDSSNRIHLVWFGGAPDSTGWRIYYQVYNGASWSSPTPISGSNASTPDIAVDGADNLHVVWHAGGNPEEIYYRKCTSGAWGSTVNLSNSSGVRSLTPRIAVDPTGNDMLVVWHEDKQTGGNWDILARRCLGGTWSGLENVSADSTLSRTADVVRDTSGNYHAAWEDTNTRNAFYSRRDVGGLWSTRSPIDTTSGRSYGVALAIDSANGIHAVWHDDNNDDWDIAYRYRSGSTWGPVVNLSNNPGVVDCGAHLDLDTSGNVFVAWHNYDNIYYCERRNGSWRPWYMISSGTYQTSPCVTTDGNSRTHITWQCRMPGSWDVWWTRQDLDVTPPAAPSDFTASASMGKVYLSWRNASGIDFKGTRVRYSTTGYPASPTDGHLASDVPGESGWTSSCVHEGLTNGVTYYYSAFSYDAVPNYSSAVHGVATPAHISIPSAKCDLPDGRPVDLYSKVVAANFATTDGCIYVQEPDRTSGIRVETADTSLNVGDVVNVSGKISTRILSSYPSERYIFGATVTRLSSGTAPGPLAMNCRSVGGGPLGGLVPGVRNGVGLNNLGLLVKTSGKVTYATGSYLYVDDGSRVKNLYGLFTEKVGVMVKCPGTPSVSQGDVVSVTGIVEGSIPNNPDWTTNRAYLHIRDWGDLVSW